MLTSIIMLTYNQIDYTKLCIESIMRFTQKETYELIIIDNGSTDDTVDWLKQQKDMKVIFNKENKGFPVACNQGVEISKGDTILFLNNDTIVTPNWLDNLLKCLNSSADIGAVGPVTNNCSYYQTIKTEYKNISELIEFACDYNKSNPALWEPRLKLIGFCLLIKRQLLERIGGFDELFSPGNYEDDDLSFRIILEGYKIYLCRDTFIHHFGNVSFKSDMVEYKRLLNSNKEKFKNKWNIDPAYSLFIRDDIISLINNDFNEEIKVLEVGCACGASLLKIKYLYPRAQVFGIELNSNAAQLARHFANISTQNIPMCQNSCRTPYKKVS